jgi:hypothetical protein
MIDACLCMTLLVLYKKLATWCRQKSELKYTPLRLSVDLWTIENQAIR